MLSELIVVYLMHHQDYIREAVIKKEKSAIKIWKIKYEIKWLVFVIISLCLREEDNTRK